MAVIGQYKCGCTYGPINKRKRLKYCAIHGDGIQDEYPHDKKMVEKKHEDNPESEV